MMTFLYIYTYIYLKQNQKKNEIIHAVYFFMAVIRIPMLLKSITYCSPQIFDRIVVAGIMQLPNRFLYIFNDFFVCFTLCMFLFFIPLLFLF